MIQLVGGLIGWVWILASIAAFLLFLGALFADVRWSSFFWAFGIGVVAKFLTRAGVETLEQSKFEASVAARRESAERLVNAYGAALAQGGSVLAEDLLPAPKDDIKGALLFAANEARAAGQPEMVAHLRAGYASLATFVPRVEAETAASFDKIVADGVGVSGQELVAVAKRIAALSSPTETVERTNLEFARLAKEFDTLLAKLSATV